AAAALPSAGSPRREAVVLRGGEGMADLRLRVARGSGPPGRDPRARAHRVALAGVRPRSRAPFDHLRHQQASPRTLAHGLEWPGDGPELRGHSLGRPGIDQRVANLYRAISVPISRGGFIRRV